MAALNLPPFLAYFLLNRLRGLAPSNVVLDACAKRNIKKLVDWYNNCYKIKIYEFIDEGERNLNYDLAESYISGVLAHPNNTPPSTMALSQAADQTLSKLIPPKGEQFTDIYRGVCFKWKHVIKTDKSGKVMRMYTLSVDKSKKDLLWTYIDNLQRWTAWKRESGRQSLNIRASKLYNIDSVEGKCLWKVYPAFIEWATLNSIGIDPKLGKKITNDLNVVMTGGQLSQAPNRNYIVYGPPELKKLPVILAIANYTGYDIYKLDLTQVTSMVEVSKLLEEIKDKSIIWIDIDPLELDKGSGKGKGYISFGQLHGFLTEDWYISGVERIIIFTVSQKLACNALKGLTFDARIQMTYCKFENFKALASTHLKIEQHELFKNVEELILNVNVTTEEVAKILLSCRDDATAALEKLIRVLQEKMQALDGINTGITIISKL